MASNNPGHPEVSGEVASGKTFSLPQAGLGLDENSRLKDLGMPSCALEGRPFTILMKWEQEPSSMLW